MGRSEEDGDLIHLRLTSLLLGEARKHFWAVGRFVEAGERVVVTVGAAREEVLDRLTLGGGGEESPSSVTGGGPGTTNDSRSVLRYMLGQLTPSYISCIVIN